MENNAVNCALKIQSEIDLTKSEIDLTKSLGLAGAGYLG